MRNGVGRIGSVPPMISTARMRSSPQLAIGKIVRSASLVMVGMLPRRDIGTSQSISSI
jgi:hypothetical protein